MNENVTVQEVLALSRKEAVEKLRAVSDAAPVLSDLLKQASKREPDAAQAMLIVALVLEQASPQSESAEVLKGLLGLLLDHVGIPSEPADRAVLQSALERIDRQYETLRERGAAFVTAQTMAELSRFRAGLASSDGELNSAYGLFLRALKLYEGNGDSYGVVAVSLEMGLLLWHFDENIAGATEHLIHAAEALADHEPLDQRSELGQVLLQQLIEKVHYLHYEAREYQLAIRLARRAVVLAPNEVIAWRILGNALSFIEKFDGAVEAYTHLTELDPKEEYSSRANLAVALVRLNRNEEALDAVTDSLCLRPNEIRPLVLRGQLLAKFNEHERAIADLENVIDLLEADRPENAEDPVEAQRYREHWSMWFAAYHDLTELYRQRDDRPALDATLTRLKASGDDALSAMGHRISGDLARQEGRVGDALSEYNAALQSFEYDTEARVARALLAAETGDVNGAIEDLVKLAPRERAPKAALEGLTNVAEYFPEELRVQRWRGFSHYELGNFDHAEEDLEYYLERVADDAEARRWFGLSLISIDPEKRDTQRDGERCFRGLEELACATSSGDAEARESLLWVIDRLILKFGFDSFFLAQSKPVLEALPVLNKLLEQLEAADFGDQDYAHRSQAFRKGIAIATDLGLPCFVAYLYARLTDIELLQGYIQSASEHIRDGKKLSSLVYAPRSAELRQQYEQMNAELGDRALEIEYMHIYEQVTEALQIVELTAARVQAAAGNQSQADDVLGELSSLLNHVDGIPAEEATVIAQTLRKAGRAEDALAVLDRAEQRLVNQGSDHERLVLLMTRATVLGSEGNIKEAIEILKKAEPLLDESRKWVAWFNIASFADAAGAHLEALEILKHFDIKLIARRDEDRFGYHLLRASSLEGSGSTLDAREAAKQAISILEVMREQRKDLELRASWSRQQTLIYAIAIRTSAATGELKETFDLVEQSRSRLLVDEMAIGRSIDDEGCQLEMRLRNAIDQRDLLAMLLNTADIQSVHSETLVRLQDLDPELEFDLVQLDEAGVEELSQERLTQVHGRAETLVLRLREQLGDYRLRSAERLFGDVVTYNACRKIMAEFGLNALIELVVQESVSLAIVVRHDREEPLLARILVDTNVDEWTHRLVRLMTQPKVEPADLEKLQAPIQPLLDVIEQDLEAEEMICIVPHGALHNVPFHALQLSTGTLIERNPIVYAPSASVLAGVLMRQGKTLGDRAIVVGDTRGDLPHADQEAHTVADLLGVEAVPRHAATRRHLLDMFSSVRELNILHLACHGYFDKEDALSSGILTTDEDAVGMPAVLSARDFLEIHLKSNLVALSACESGISDVSAGDELMGLTRALLVGGVHSVLGSLWKVNDLSTSILIRYFYECWINEGLSKAGALRAAQCHLMRLTRDEARAAMDSQVGSKARDIKGLSSSWVTRSDPNEPIFASPLYWAAFTLVGNWR